jgi:RNA polymerase sigma-70 factor (ECF subfamily)
MAAFKSLERNLVLEQCQMLSDEQVVALVLAGQIALFEVLIRRHGERLYRAIRAITQDDEGVDRLIEQAYVNAYGRLAELAPQERFAPWLTRIAISEAMTRAETPEKSKRVRA